MAIDPGTSTPPAGFTRTLVVATFSNYLNICTLPTQTLYTASSAGTIAPGMILYWDDALTNPVTGYSYVLDPAIGSIFNLNDLTGEIQSDTGQTC
ncbi:MAG: hypothetical protein IM569_13615 [Chitinophagaceae bacterium]|nr:hypothetical protein [Chitinophagaceae bacterium]MCA6513887.1 hypothetical protein [Chitinophagaceae bacterium]